MWMQDLIESPAQAGQAMSFKDFLEHVPPGKSATVSSVVVNVSIKSKVPVTLHSANSGPHFSRVLNLPMLELHCDTCKGVRFFSPKLQHDFSERGYFISFECKNCQKSTKTYAIEIKQVSIDNGTQSDTNKIIHKYGENPAFGAPIPSRVISLVGSEKEYFLKGRRAEQQGLGIGAFAYYRRVVESRKDQILDEITRVAKKIGAPQEMLDELQAAKREKQFETAVKAVKHGIPQTLLIDGQHNPLTLLHSALSEGLHAQTDEQCLKAANSVRVVLTALVARMGDALKDNAELSAAVSRLLKAKDKN